MSYVAGAAGGATAAHAAAIARAIKASGAIVQVLPEDFELILSRAERPLVVTAEGGWWSKNYRYLTAYGGLIFYAKSSEPLRLPADVELIASKKIWIPG